MLWFSDLDALTTIDGRADDDVWFGGKKGALYHWDGDTLTRVNGGTRGDIIHLQVLPDGRAWAAALVSQGLPYESRYSQLLAWDGSAWSVVLERIPLTTPSARRTFLATESGDVWFATNTGLFRWSEGALQRLSPERLNEGRESLWANGPHEVWVGIGSTVKRWNGSALVDVTDIPQEEIDTIWGTGPGDVWILPRSTLSGSLILHWNGSQLTSYPIGPGHPDDLWFGMMGTGPNDVWVNHEGKLLHWDGQAWKAMAGPLERAYVLRRVGPDSVWIRGSVDDQVMHWDGQTMRQIPETGEGRVTHAHLRDVWALSPTDVWAVGDSGTALHRDGEGWNVVPTPTQADLTGVSGSSTRDVWAVGKQGVVLHWDGTAWTRVELGTSADLDAVWAATPGFVTIVGDQGTLLQLREGQWSMHSSTVSRLNRVWARSPDEIWVTDIEGTIYHSSGTELSVVLRRRYPQYTSKGLWGMGPESLFAAGLVKQGADWVEFRHPIVGGGCHACVSQFTPMDAWEDPHQRTWFIGEFLTNTGASSPFWLTFVKGRCSGSSRLGPPISPFQPTALHGTGAHDIWSVGTYGRIHHLSY
ncbi:hypothetical protein [Melittangium boletus]|nr:hypothetical protein [Melittangium boletus]